MPDNLLPNIVRPAERGSKDGWQTVTGEVPPDLFDRLMALVRSLPAFRTDLVREGIELVVAQYENQRSPDDRRQGDRRKSA